MYAGCNRLFLITLSGFFCLLLGSGALGPAATSRAAAPQSLLVFAAASTTNALTDVGRAFQARTGIKVVNSFASSSTLAKQIARGAPADIYVSANVKWMDYLEKSGALQPGARFDLLHNRIVLIAPDQSPLGPLEVKKGLKLAALLAGGRLAMGNPDHVPAGIYAKQALVSLGLWPQVGPKIAAAPNVRVALALVERGEAPMGVVYATDAAITKKVKVLGVFPRDSHKPIVYPAAMLQGRDSAAGRRYLKFLRSPAAAAIFKKYGFRTK